MIDGRQRVVEIPAAGKVFDGEALAGVGMVERKRASRR
jgi:hypothetical protein